MDDASHSPAPRRDLPRIARGPAELPPVPVVLWALVGVTAAIEIGLEIADSGYFGRPVWRTVAIAYFGFHDPLFDGTVRPLWPGQEYAMALTHAFLHGDFWHLALNMVVLLAVGKVVAGLVGPVRMILLFVICAVAGGLTFGLLTETNVPMVGASGAVFGFIAFWKQAEFRRRLRLGLGMGPILGLVVALVLANVALELFMNIAWQAHLGGFVAGWAIGMLWHPVTRRDAVLPGVPPG